MKFKLPWKSSSLFIIFLIAVPFFSPARLQYILGGARSVLIMVELTLFVFGVFNFLVMFNQEVVSSDTFKAYYGSLMYLIYWLAISATLILACLVILGG